MCLHATPRNKGSALWRGARVACACFEYAQVLGPQSWGSSSNDNFKARMMPESIDVSLILRLTLNSHVLTIVYDQATHIYSASSFASRILG